MRRGAIGLLFGMTEQLHRRPSMIMCDTPTITKRYEFLYSHLDCDCIADTGDEEEKDYIKVLAYSENKDDNVVLENYFSRKVITRDEAKDKYKGCLILMIEDGRKTGKVYAISDNVDSAKIADLQSEMFEKNIETHQINNLEGIGSGNREI